MSSKTNQYFLSDAFFGAVFVLIVAGLVYTGLQALCESKETPFFVIKRTVSH